MPTRERPALAVRDQRDGAEAGLDRGGGVAHVDHERAAADARAVDVRRRDAEVLGDGDGRLAGAEHAVDVVLRQAGIGERVEGGLGVQLQRRLVGLDADAVGLGGADDGGAHAQAHVAAPIGRNMRQRDVVVLLLPRHLDRQVDRQVLGRGLDADDVRHHARTLIELDDGDDVRRVVLEAVGGDGG